MPATPNSIITPQSINTPAANAVLSTAMTSTKAYDGTEAVGTAMALVYTAGSNGSQLPKLKAHYSGTNGAAPSGTTNATVLRIWLNNGSANTSAANNILVGDVAVPAATMSAVAAMAHPTEFDFGGLAIPAGWRVYAGLATAMGGTSCALAVSMPGGGDL